MLRRRCVISAPGCGGPAAAQAACDVSRPCQAPVLHPQFANKCLGGSVPMFAIRSGNFQLSLMLATALTVLVLHMAAEAYTPEGRQACTGDAFRLCSAEIPNVDRVRACLHR